MKLGEAEDRQYFYRAGWENDAPHHGNQLEQGALGRHRVDIL